MNNKEFIEEYLRGTAEISNSVNIEEIEKFIEILFEAWKNEKKVITMGNGGSASTASHFAGDLSKTVINPSSEKEIVKHKKGFKAICLNDNAALLTAWINDCGWDNVYSGALNTLLEEGDVVLLVSVHGGSGWSGNIVEAMKMANKRNCKILGLAGFDGGKMKEMADVCIVVPKNSTPHVEGFHGVLQHMIIQRLLELITEYSQNSVVERLQEIIKKYDDPLIKSNIKEIIEGYNNL
ncbi:MAG: SIS domain-containing protein [Candidatus Pacearchaeota archaeon]|nr:SIS domain-containing protein [Candidatus Pacearchaeota archaeon]